MSVLNLDMETLTVKENELKTKDTYFVVNMTNALYLMVISSAPMSQIIR